MIKVISQPDNIRFQHYTADQGLSQNMVDCMLKDSKGFMWFGTWNGLDRFDGYTFTVYKQDANHNNSISNNFIYSMCEDLYKNIWIGTGSGLNVYIYDEDRFVTYKHHPGNDTSIISDRINAVMRDKNGDIWIGTDKGVDKIKVEDRTGKIKQITHDHGKLNFGSYSGSNVLSLLEDKQGNIWVGTDNGVYFYNRTKKTITHYEDQPGSLNGLSENTVHTIYQDKYGTIWIGTSFGLSRLDIRSHYFQNYYNDPSNPSSLVHNAVMSITEDLNGKLIIGTLGGLSIYNYSTDNFTNYSYHLNDNYGLNNEFINCLLADKEGNVWIGTERGGINKYTIYQKHFEYFVYKPLVKNSLSHNTINSIWEDKNYIWIGTAGGGLNRYNKATGNYKHYRFDANNPDALSSDFITSIVDDRKGNLWIGTWGGGLHKLTPENKEKGKFIHYRRNNSDNKSLVNDFVSSILSDKWGNLWIGTLGGLDKFDPATGKFEHVTSRYRDKPINQVGCLKFDQKNNLWIGTVNGLFEILSQTDDRINIHNSRVNYFINIPGDNQSISGNYVISINSDDKGNLWFGTYGKGLDKLVSVDAKNGNGKFISYSQSDGLSNNIVYGILEDKTGNLWLSTDNGLSKFNPDSKQFRNYYAEDGLLSNQFYWAASYKSKSGKLYFGGMNGLNAFYPDSIMEDTTRPVTVLTNFKIYNQQVEVGKEYHGRELLKTSIPYTDHITLSYKSREFSFEFSALDYDQPQRIMYAYKMDGFDNRWTNVDARRRFANYTNLKGGDYTFMVMSTNEDGISEQYPLKLNITIIPPFWKTTGFRVSLIILILGLIFSYNRYRVYSLRQQKKKLEKQVKERTAKIEEQKEELRIQAENLKESYLQLEKRQELIEGQKRQLEVQNTSILEQRNKLMELNKKVQHINQQQLKFFTQISHEFRTPLTLISTPIELLLQDLKEGNIRDKLKLVYKNAQRLLHLINQLMEIRKVETGNVVLKTSKGNIVEFVTSIAQLFNTLANQRNINFRVSAEPDIPEIFFDADKIENIVYNLLSNAFKYTKDNKHIILELKINSGHPDTGDIIQIIDKSHYKHEYHNINKFVEISITDSGPGIEHDHIKDIFRRFYRIHSQSNYSVKGTGIGLYLVKKLIKAHKGLLYVKSVPNFGSIFGVLLPISATYLTAEEIVSENTNLQNQQNIVHLKVLDEQPKHSSHINNHHKTGVQIPDNIEKPLLLLVDDDDELRAVTIDYLSHSFRIIEAENGKKGVEKANMFQPDLIISDIMMPEMDGYELCNYLKSKVETSHIPIILLTAKSEVDDFIEGLESGADDYIPKPFNIKILEAKSKSLIENRKRLRKLFEQSLVPVPKEITTTTADEQFLLRAIKIVEDNLNNPEFTVQQLAAEMFISRSLLHKKLTAIVDLSANDFITSMRLKKSVLLLMQGTLNISEVAFDVGFNDPKYFSRCFRKNFGVSPTEFIQTRQES